MSSHYIKLKEENIRESFCDLGKIPAGHTSVKHKRKYIDRWYFEITNTLNFGRSHEENK